MSQPIFDPNIPQFLNDALSVTQKSFLDNFMTLFMIYNRNHESLNSNRAGNHTNIELLNQSNSIETNVSEINLYAKSINDRPNDLPSRFTFRYQGNGKEFTYVPYQIYDLISVNGSKDFFTFLPGNFLVYFGSIPGPSPIGQPSGIFELRPPIAKNIASAVFTPLGITPLQNPTVQILPATDGYFTKIQIGDPDQPNFAPQACFYLIVANT